MEKLVLMCAYNQETYVLPISKDTTLECIHEKLSQRWKGFNAETMNLNYILHQNPSWPIKTQSDVQTMFEVAEVYNTRRADIKIELIEEQEKSNTASVRMNTNTMTLPECCSSNTKSTMLALEYNVDNEETDYSEYSTSRRTTSKLTAGWDRLIVYKGQRFKGGAQSFRIALQRQYTETGFNYDMVRNSKKKIKAVCRAKGTRKCGWFVHAKLDKATEEFVIKKINNIHTCGATARKFARDNRMTPELISKEIVDKIRNDPTYSATQLHASSKSDFGRQMSYMTAWRALKKAKDSIYGDVEESFKALPAYIQALRKSNPGSVIEYEFDKEERHFQRLFIAFDACIQGFQHCRPLLFLDGAHLKYENHGHILAATGKDGDNGLYPLCFALVQHEDTDNWTWFMEKLKSLPIPQRQLTFISDRNAGLIDAIAKLFPGCPHAYCIRHLAGNLKTHFTGKGVEKGQRKEVVDLFYEAAKAPTVEEYEEKITKMKEIGGLRAERFLSKLDPKHWAKAHFEGNNYGHKASSLAESFNNWVLVERHYPALNMVDGVRLKMMKRLEERRQHGMTFTAEICKKTNDLLDNLIKTAKTLPSITATSNKYEVLTNPTASVNLEEKTCSCKEWQRNGYPCVHALAVIVHIPDFHLEDYVDPAFKTESFLNSYQYCINPMAGPYKTKDTTEELLPPVYTTKPGRPKTKRIPSQGESRGKRKIECSNCGELGHHNKKSCKKSKTD